MFSSLPDELLDAPITLRELKEATASTTRSGIDVLSRAVNIIESERRAKIFTPYVRVHFRGGSLSRGAVYRVSAGNPQVGDLVTVTSSSSFGAVAVIDEVNAHPAPLDQIKDAVLIGKEDRARIEAALGKAR